VCKTTDIVIERDGLINIRPPKEFSVERIDAVVESKRMWIYKNHCRMAGHECCASGARVG
jgi:hypothetical protein